MPRDHITLSANVMPQAKEKAKEKGALAEGADKSTVEIDTNASNIGKFTDEQQAFMRGKAKPKPAKEADKNRESENHLMTKIIN